MKFACLRDLSGYRINQELASTRKHLLLESDYASVAVLGRSLEVLELPPPHIEGKPKTEGSIPATRFDLDRWMKRLPQPWSAAMEGKMFSGWIHSQHNAHFWHPSVRQLDQRAAVHSEAIYSHGRLSTLFVHRTIRTGRPLMSILRAAKVAASVGAGGPEL